MAGNARLDELRRTMESAKLRYEAEVSKATGIFTAPDAKQIPDFLRLWETHRQNVLDAFKEYRAAVDAYLNAAGTETN